MKDFRFKPSDILKRKWNVTMLSEDYPKNVMVLDCVANSSDDTFFRDQYFLVDLDGGRQYHATVFSIHQSYSRVA
jgi:hypothetical protein